MIPTLLVVATLAQWFLAPLQLFNGIVFFLYACVFVTIALRQWVWLLVSLLLIALLMLFGASNFVLTTVSIGVGVVTLGIFARYVDAGQVVLRTLTLCSVWIVSMMFILLSYAIPDIDTYITAIGFHVVFIFAWSLASSKELT